LLGVQLSAGSSARFVRTGHQQLAEVETHLKAALVKTKVIHQDETALRVGTMGWWVHVCSTARLTHYAAHPSRGRTALNAIGIAPQFRGTSVHDGFRSYQGYGFTHAWCNVHHLRELTVVEEELKQAWARNMKELCWLLGTSVHKIRESRQYNRPHLPSCLHEKAYRPGNSRTGKPILNEYSYTSLINQVEKEHILLIPGRKRAGNANPSSY
jgi:transposase